MVEKVFSERMRALEGKATQVETRVLTYLGNNRETALHASAAQIASAVGTSDATVIRTARKLGYDGLDALRRALADDLRRDLTLSQRMANEVAQANSHSPLSGTTEALRGSLDAIDALDTENVALVVEWLGKARRVQVFGIGPSGFIAGYFAAQLVRLGVDARALTRTGLQFADDLVGVVDGDMVVALAYDRSYPEVRALFDRVADMGLPSTLITATGGQLPDDRAGAVLRVPRGRSEGFGLHAGTLALIEGLLIALSVAEPERSRTSLDALNAARQALSGHGMDI